MPKSRGRKKKPTVQKRALGRSHTPRFSDPSFPPALAALAARLDDGPPAWFAPATDRVLGADEELAAANSPRELEAVVARLLGRELHRAMSGEDPRMKNYAWFAAMLDSAFEQVRGSATEDGRLSGTSGLRLLHGMLALAPRELGDVAAARYAAARKGVQRAQRQGDAGALAQPAWLFAPPRVAATGRTWMLNHPETARYGYLIEVSWRGEERPDIFLVDVDACGMPMVANAALFGDIDQAVAAWPELAGPRQRDVEPIAVEHPGPLFAWHTGVLGDAVFGFESADLFENWFRVRRRTADLATALRKQGAAMPEPVRDRVMTRAMIEREARFPAWYSARHGAEPEEDTAAWVIEQWDEESVLGTEWVISEHRAAVHSALLSDEGGREAGALDLLAEWIRYVGELDGASQDLVERAAAVALGQPRSPDECPGMP